ncbi:hypothetical protein [Actinomadura chokoriensis]|uniref:Uncharacterized protein n=1 Tax=Actinomadura chokoriensis TaxID=454156 RepID=A0ABV4QWX0_9ACTN
MFGRPSERFGDDQGGHDRADEGVEVLCGAVQGGEFGAVVILGAGGVDTAAPADRAARAAVPYLRRPR